MKDLLRTWSLYCPDNLPDSLMLTPVAEVKNKILSLLFGASALCEHEKRATLAPVFESDTHIYVYAEAPLCAVFTAMCLLVLGEEAPVEISALYERVAKAYGPKAPSLEAIFRLPAFGVVKVGNLHLYAEEEFGQILVRLIPCTLERISELETEARKGPLHLLVDWASWQQQSMIISLLQRLQNWSADQTYDFLYSKLQGFLGPRETILYKVGLASRVKVPGSISVLTIREEAPEIISVRSLEEHKAAVQAIIESHPKRLLLHRRAGYSLSLLVGQRVYIFEDLELRRHGVISAGLRDLLTGPFLKITLTASGLRLEDDKLLHENVLEGLGFGNLGEWLSHILQQDVLEPILPEGSQERPLTAREKARLATYIRQAETALQRATRL